MKTQCNGTFLNLLKHEGNVFQFCIVNLTKYLCFSGKNTLAFKITSLKTNSETNQLTLEKLLSMIHEGSMTRDLMDACLRPYLLTYTRFANISLTISFVCFKLRSRTLIKCFTGISSRCLETTNLKISIKKVRKTKTLKLWGYYAMCLNSSQ